MKNTQYGAVLAKLTRHYLMTILAVSLALAGCGGSAEPSAPPTTEQETSLSVLEGSGGTIAIEVSGDAEFSPVSGRFAGRDLYFYGGVAAGATSARQEVMIYLPMTLAEGTFDAAETGITFTVTEGNNFLGIASNPTGTITFTQVGDTLAGELNLSDAGLTVTGTFSDVPAEGMTTGQAGESPAESAAASGSSVATTENNTAAATPPTAGQEAFTVVSIPLQEETLSLSAELAFDGDAAWVLLYEQDVLLKIDSETNTITQRFDLGTAGFDTHELAAGEGSVWVSGQGTLEAGRSHLRSVARIDPDSVEIIAEVAFPTEVLTVVEGAVWALGGSRLHKLDLQTNAVLDEVRVPLRLRLASDVQMAFAEGAIWLLGEDEQTEQDILLQIDALTLEVVNQVEIEQIDQPYIRLASGEGSLWLGGYSDMCAPECSTLISRFDVATNAITPLVLPDEITRSNYVWQLAEAGGNLWACVAVDLVTFEPSLLRLDMGSGEILSSLPSNCVGRQQTIAFGADSVWALNLSVDDSTLYLHRYELAQFR
jgi:streptogramin lyase